MLTLTVIWELSFSSLEVFVGVGIIWLMFIETRIPSRQLSVILMIVVALLAAALNFYNGLRKVRKTWNAAQEQIRTSEAAAIEYEGEIG